MFHLCPSVAKTPEYFPQLCAEAGVSPGSDYIGTMNWRRHLILGLVVTGGLYARPVLAATAAGDNPYQPIVDRNVFGLVPIPTNPPVDPASLVPPPKITPNGIMTIFGKLQVLFKVAGVAQPGQPPKDESYVMCEGDRQDEIEVQKIDEASATITFNNHGVIQELPLVAGTASGGGDATPASPGFAPGRGGAPIGFGGRFGRNRNLPAASNPNPGGDAGGGGTPSFGGGTATSAITGANQQPAITPEAQVLLMEANRIATQDQVIQGTMPPLPPTVLTPPDAKGVGGVPLVAGPPGVPGDGAPATDQ
jgi:hypothetical protein